jgi:hypothetical protein
MEVNLQMITRPFQLARANNQMVRATLDAGAAALGHGPAATAGAVQGDVDRAVVTRLHGCAVPRKAGSVIW